ncbi:MAG: molybdopterin-synthase adenylyltransferase MoeB [Xanthomonadaceae bacterium]|nr:molybdopterin-synthase adenylyltransferase MoeB [Xanthomonadaceae bacterium]MDP2185693.1 molybdopterin-synthase adenylyltransferase MoeB [Xanthomonadales bacterium]MDZ4116603.1 molybdopterin-synthase adenylyltransferase MoeB [Xanthomonadaceae bacterium]MDZ4379194.1 molybdopterin-synthase adenylyltransferase MoeB [Xanthomonadaceae bacterium]
MSTTEAFPSEIDPPEALRRLGDGALLIDIREQHERALGMAHAALGVARAALEAEPGRWLADPEAPVMLICAHGNRSRTACDTLRVRGYARVCSVAGGTEAWAALGLPMTAADSDAGFYQRYARHLSVPEIGVAGQRRLQRSRVLLVGAGGLGSPAGYYLAAAGVGHISVIDDDRVERSNLQRQILHTDARIGVAKTESAQIALAALNPDIDIVAVPQRLDRDNVDAQVSAADVIVDGADNFAARYLLSDACVKHGKPLVYGAVHRFEGQASVFDAGRQRGTAPCYRCLFPEPPPAQFAPNCAEAGVLGVVPGVIGMIQATEAIKLLLDIGESLSGRLLQFDALTMRFRETRLKPDPDCTVCAPGRAFPGYIDYQAFCGG